MRGVDLAAKIRNIERILGLEIEHDEVMRLFTAFDTKLGVFAAGYGKPSDAERRLKALHSEIYRARGERVYRNQKGKCVFCGRKLPPDAWEIDHIESRGAHGRSDELANLRVCCTGLDGCGLHRKRHGG